MYRRGVGEGEGQIDERRNSGMRRNTQEKDGN